MGMTRRKPKYKNRFNRDWEFYLRHIDSFAFSGAIPKEFEYDPDGPDAKATFYHWESDCILFPTSEPELLQKVHTTKGAVNFHIKLWADGYSELFEPVDSYLDSFDNPPHWIRKAFENTLRRLYGDSSPGWFLWPELSDEMATGCE